MRSWYRQAFGHPELGTDRMLVTADKEGPVRGVQLPEAFDTWQEFWHRDPAPRPF